MAIFNNGDRITLETSDNYLLTISGSNLALVLEGTHDPVLWTVEVIPGGYNFYQVVNGANQYLDGRTLDGSVGLAPSTTGVYTGTAWAVAKTASSGTDEGSFVMVCLGDKPGVRVLNGVGSSGTINLVMDAGTCTTSNSLIWSYSISV